MKPMTMSILESAARAHEERSLAEPHAMMAALLLAAGKEAEKQLVMIDLRLTRAARLDDGWEDG